MSKKIVIKTTVRMLVYQVLILFIVLSSLFLMNPIYWGNRSGVISQSYRHIFNPVEYSPEIEKFVKKIGRTRLFFELSEKNGYIPDLFEIIPGSEFVVNEEWYNCEYQYVNNDGIIDLNNYRTRVKWKPWELQYPDLDDLKPVNGAKDFNDSPTK